MINVNNLNFIDMVIMLTLLYHAFTGLRQGCVRTLCDILAICGGLVGSAYYFKPIGWSLYTTFHINIEIANLIGFVGFWMATFFILNIVGKVLTEMIETAGISLINRIGGLGMGAIKGIVYLLPILTPLIYIRPEIMLESYFIKPITPIIETLFPNQK